jgi:hypothetical protein
VPDFVPQANYNSHNPCKFIDVKKYLRYNEQGSCGLYTSFGIIRKVIIREVAGKTEGQQKVMCYNLKSGALP